MHLAATGAERHLRVNVRRARAGEARALSILALESKQHWGYTPQDVERWRAEIAIDADPHVEPFYVACGARRSTNIAILSGRSTTVTFRRWGASNTRRQAHRVRCLIRRAAWACTSSM